MDDLLGKMAGGILGGGGGQAGMAAVLFQLLQNQPGGLAGLLKEFQSKGLGDIANSWVGTGPNLPVSAQQIEHGLGTDILVQIAKQLGVPPQAAAVTLSGLLPNLVDKLTPQGQVPDQSNILAGGLGALQGLLK